jgi:succinyl-CoA synthetase beta subunit
MLQDSQGHFVCLDAKLRFDDNAEYRYKHVFIPCISAKTFRTYRYIEIRDIVIQMTTVPYTLYTIQPYYFSSI